MDIQRFPALLTPRRKVCRSGKSPTPSIPRVNSSLARGLPSRQNFLFGSYKTGLARGRSFWGEVSQINCRWLYAMREIPPPAGENAGLRDDASRKFRSLE